MSNEFTYTKEVTGEIVQIPIGMLRHHPLNPRKELGDLTELAESIRAKGVMQNLTVVPDTIPEGATRWKYGYLVVIGNRRMEAAKIAGLETLPCIIAEMSEAEQVQTMLLENIQRSDLTVYEQAKGFQMMMQFGSTLEEVAEKTGFSKTSIRRRLKIADLDNSTLREVSKRQVSLADFDRLAEIFDLDVRNEVLKSIGTANFDLELTRALRQQKIESRLPEIKALIKEKHALKIERSQTWGGKYFTVAALTLAEWDGHEPDLPTDKKLYYYLDEEYGECKFYTEKEKAAPVRRSAEELQKEKSAREAFNRLEQMNAVHWKLRQDFAAGITVTAKNRAKLLLWCARAIAFEHCRWLPHIAPDDLAAAFGLDAEDFKRDYNARYGKLADALGADEDLIPKLLWMHINGSGKDEKYYVCSAGMMEAGMLPMFQPNQALDLIYDFLCDFGYQLSDEEAAMKTGKLPWFSAGKNEEDASEGAEEVQP